MSPSQPVATVIVPTFNRVQLLADAVGSVLDQTRGDWELVVVDDGSTDDTASYVRGIGDERIRFIPGPRVGVVATVRNRGADGARGRYLAFLDSDDTWRPHKLERQLAAVEEVAADWSFTGYEVVGPSGKHLATVEGPEATGDQARFLRRLLSTEVSAAASTLLVSRRAFREEGGFCPAPELLYREDLDLVLRLANRWSAAPVRDVLATIRDHPGRSTRRDFDPFLRSAEVYRRFLKRGEDRACLRVARVMLTRHLTSSALRDVAEERPGAAPGKLAACVREGLRSPRWWMAWVRALWAGMRSRFR